MRLIQITSLVVLITFGLLLISSDAQTSEIYVTHTTMTDLPAKILPGTTVQITSTTVDNFGTPVGIGETLFLDLMEDSFGQGRNGTFSTSQLNYSFTATTDVTINGFRIPVLSISQIPKTLYWEVWEEQNKVASGNFLENEVREGINTSRSLYVVFNSHQTNFQLSSLSLTSGRIYSLRILLPTQATITVMRAVNSTVSVGSEKVFFSLLYLQSSSLKTISSGSASANLTLNKEGEHRILSYYSNNDAGLFGPSFAEEIVQVSARSDLNVVFPSVSSSRLLVTELVATVDYIGTYIMGADVQFSIRVNSIWETLGTSITNSSGIAVLSFIPRETPGNYDIRASVKFQSTQTVEVSSLSLSVPVANFVQLSAVGIYGSGSVDNGSRVEVVGRILDSQSNPVVNVDITLYSPTSNFSTISNTTGYFQFNVEVFEDIGYYSSYFRLTSSTSDYVISDVILPLEIKLGQFQVTSPKFMSVTNDDISISVSGNITTKTGRMTFGDVELRVVTPQGEVSVDNVTHVLNFTLSFNNSYFFGGSGVSLGFGDHILRLYISASRYETLIHEIQLTVLPANATITREGIFVNGTQVKRGLLSDPSEYILVDYSTSLQMSARALNSLGDPINGAELKFEVLVSGSWELMGYNFTGIDGTAYLNWMPSLRHSAEPVGTFKVTLLSSNYSSSFSYFYYVSVGVRVDLQISVSNAYYGADSIIHFVATDEFGNRVVGLPLSVDIGTTRMWEFVTNQTGEYDVIYRFPNAGTYTLTSAFNQHFFYYKQFSNSIAVSISKAVYRITSSNVSISGGSVLELNMTLTDSLGSTVQGIPVSLFFNGSTVFNGITDGDGFVTYISNSPLALPIGTYQYRWSILSSSNYESAEQIVLVDVVSVQTSIDISVSNFAYGTDNSALISLQSKIKPDLYSTGSLSLYVEIVGTGFNRTLTTDASGLASLLLPSDLLPGNYSLSVSFAGSGVLLPSSSTQLFTVFGASVTLKWIEVPSNVKVGQNLRFSFQLTSGGKPLPFVNLTVSVDKQYLLVSDNQGVVVFDRLMTKELNGSDIVIRMFPIPGYNSLTVVHPITIYKEGMDILMSSPPSLNYTDSEVFNFTVVDDSSLPVQNATVVVYIKIGISGGWTLYDSYLSGSDGTFSLFLDTTELKLTAQQIVYLKFEVSHVYYMSSVDTGISITILPEPLIVHYTPGNETFYSDSTVVLNITDNEGTAVEGLLVRLYAPGSTDEIARGWTDAQGMVYLNVYFEEPPSGLFLVYIQDSNRNFLSLSQEITIQFNKIDVIADAAYTSVNGLPYLEVIVKTTTQIGVNTFVDIYSCDLIDASCLSWKYVGTAMVQNGTYLFNTGQQDSLNFYRFLIYETNSTLSTSLDVRAEMFNVVLSGRDEVIEYGDLLLPDLNLTNVPPFNFVISVYVDGTYIGDLLYNGELNSDLYLTLPVGVYSMNLVVEFQGWVRSSDISVNLKVIQETFYVSSGNVSVPVGEETEVQFTVLDNDNSPVDAYVVLDIRIGSDYYRIGSAYAVDGIVTLSLQIPVEWTPDQYTLRVYATVNPNYRGYEDIRVIFLKEPVTITLVDVPPIAIIYSQGMNFGVQVTSSLDGRFMAGTQILITLTDEARNVLDFFQFDVTDSNGIVNYVGLLSEWSTVDLQGTMLIITVVEQDLVSSNELVLVYGVDYIFQPLSVSPEVVIVDHGITRTQEVFIRLFSGDSEVSLDTVGSEVYTNYFEFALYASGTDFNVVFKQGSLYPEEINGSLYFRFVLEDMGQWDLVLDFKSNRYSIPNDRIIVSIGWSKVSSKFTPGDGTTIELEYLEGSFNMTLTTQDGTPLEGIPLIVTTPFSEYVITTGFGGNFNVSLPPEFFVPSTVLYKISIRTAEDVFLSQQESISVYLKITPIQSEFSVNLDDFYVDEKPDVMFTSQLPEGNYSLLIYDGSGALLLNSSAISEEELVGALYSYSWDIGNYSMYISRIDPFYDPMTKFIDFEVMKIPTTIELSYEYNGSSYLFTITLLDSRDDRLIENSPGFIVTLIANGRSQSFNVTGWTFEVEFTSPFSVLVEAGGEYRGSVFVPIQPSENPSVNPSQSVFQIPEFAVVIGVMLIGFVITRSNFLSKIQGIVSR